MAVELGKLRKKRSANINALDGLFAKIERVRGKPNIVEKDVKNVTAMLQTIQKKEKLIKETEDRIVDMMPDEEIDAFVESIMDNEVATAERTNDVEDFLARFMKKEDGVHPSGSKAIERVPEVEKKATVILPKITIKKFHGEPTACQGFFDTFQATVGSNSALSDIEKFTYLRGYLAGEAERCIDGLVLTSDNYNAALDILKERYGNRQLIVASHMNRILKLERVASCKSIKPLRSLYDEIESHVRSLFSVGVRSEEYGPLLIPIIVEKLPDEIKLEISKKGKIHQDMHFVLTWLYILGFMHD